MIDQGITKITFQDIVVGNCAEQISLGRNSSSPNGHVARPTRFYAMFKLTTDIVPSAKILKPFRN